MSPKSNPTPVDLTKRAGDDVEAAWSPTGKNIAFTSYYRDDGMPQLFLMNPDGSEQVRLSERFAEHSPTWTPKGTYLYYVMDYADFSVLSMRGYLVQICQYEEIRYVIECRATWISFSTANVNRWFDDRLYTHHWRQNEHLFGYDRRPRVHGDSIDRFQQRYICLLVTGCEVGVVHQHPR